MRHVSLVLSLSFTAVVVGVGAIGVADPDNGSVVADPVPEFGIASAARAVAQGQQFRQVNMSVSCVDGELDDVNIQPWTAQVSRQAGQQLRWRLLPASDVDSAIIRPKGDSRWPFGSTPPLTVTSGGNATVDSGPITGADGSYFYDIVVNCGAGETVIDPRMDIRP